MPTPEPEEALEAPPWQPAYGPPPSVQTWAHGKAPALEIYVRGQWRHARVLGLDRYRDGRRAVNVQLILDHPTSTQLRTYRWNPAAIRIVEAGDPPLQP